LGEGREEGLSTKGTKNTKKRKEVGSWWSLPRSGEDLVWLGSGQRMHCVIFEHATDGTPVTQTDARDNCIAFEDCVEGRAIGRRVVAVRGGRC
jgi:hypothetical protein